MALKMFILLLVACCLHISNVNALPSINDLVNSTVAQTLKLFAPIETSIQNAISQGQNVLKGLQDQAESVVNSTIFTTQQLIAIAEENIMDGINKTVQAGINVDKCIQKLPNVFQEILSEVGGDISACTTNAILQVVEVLADLGTLYTHVTSWISETPGKMSSCISLNVINTVKCLTNEFETATSKGIMFTSSVAGDGAKIFQLGGSLFGTIMKCEIDEISKITEKVGDVVQGVEDCLKEL